MFTYSDSLCHAAETDTAVRGTLKNKHSLSKSKKKQVFNSSVICYQLSCDVILLVTVPN